MISRIVRQVRTGNGVFAWFRANSIIITFLLGQGLIFGGWMLSQELADRQHTVDILYARDSITAMRADIARIDDRGSREIPEIKVRLQNHEDRFASGRKQIEDLIANGSPTIRARLDAMKEQQDRITRELDTVRDELNNHVRFDRQTKGDIPLPPRRSPQ